MVYVWCRFYGAVRIFGYLFGGAFVCFVCLVGEVCVCLLGIRLDFFLWIVV